MPSITREKNCHAILERGRTGSATIISLAPVTLGLAERLFTTN